MRAFTASKRVSSRSSPPPSSRKYYWWFLAAALFFCTTTTTHMATALEAEWTPNPESEQPLPLSQNQRDQLLQLEQVILQSPDPEGTLNQAAQANGMDPMDLLDLLERNRQQLEQAGAPVNGGSSGGGGGGGVRGRNVWKMVTSLGVVAAQAASKNPRAFSLAAVSLLLVAYISISAPRTGLVLSKGRGMSSSGATTMWNPPSSYMDHVLQSPRFLKNGNNVSFASKKLAKDLDPLLTEDGTIWHGGLKRIKALKQGASAQVTVAVEDFLDDNNQDDEQAAAAVLDLCLDQAFQVLEDRQLTEWVKPVDSLRFISAKDGDKSHAILTVRKMGDWGRYGLLPLQVTADVQDDNGASLTVATLQGSHWDGQIQVQVRQHGGNLVVRVHLLVPKKGRKVSRSIALSIVEGLSQSIATSVRTRTKQSLARRSQSTRFQGKFKSRALERRHTRLTKEKDLEEMAVDRRRRWQRGNPDAGRYRPSNDRMKSPKNCYM